MEVFPLSYPLDVFRTFSPSVMAIGYFDGVHLGHRRVIQRGIDMAKSEGLPVSVMTFDPHPREVLGKSGYTRYLTPLEDKLALFAKMGVDFTYLVRFDIALAAVYPEDFIEEFLVPLKAKHIVVGFDFTFGYRGQGTAQTLLDQGRGRYGVDVVGPVSRFGEKVGSTLIRNCLHQGEITLANILLGRPYRMEGIVVHGEKRGRTIGFPTANVRLEKPYLLPKNGVYGVKVYHRDKEYYGVMNIGIKPTFANQRKEKTLEVHIFDFSGDLYGEPIALEVHFFVRDEQKFAGVEELKGQIEKDVAYAKRKFFAKRADGEKTPLA
ncbi:bifunctional riboflavin kinase/FAD synthetase [Bacillaceae bacterium]